MIIFSPSVHEAVDSLNLVARVRIVDDRSPLLSRVPIDIPAPAWRSIHADVYPADGYEIRNGMTITPADIDALDSFLNEDPAELFNRVRLLNADVSRRWAHSESIDGYAYPSRHSRKRKRASVYDEAVEFKRTGELFQHDLHRPSRIRTRTSSEVDNSTPAWTDVYMAEKWYCRSSYVEDVGYWPTREPEDPECTSTGFVFATPAVSLDDLSKYSSTISGELLDSLLDAFGSLSVSKSIAPLFEQAQSYIGAVFSDFTPCEPDDIDASACWDTVEESKRASVTLDKFIIEISDDEADGDDYDGDQTREAQYCWPGATPLADKAFIIEASDGEDDDDDNSIPKTDSNESRSDKMEDKQYSAVTSTAKMCAIELIEYAKVAATKSTNVVEGDDNFFSQPLTPIPGRGRNIIASVSAFLDTLPFLRIG